MNSKVDLTSQIIEPVQSPVSDQEPDKTTVGNFFISNYPPYAYWTHERRPEALDALQKPPAPDARLGLYTHLPFCRKRCHFCYFRVYTGRDARPDRVSTYIETLLSELRMYVDKPLIRGRKPSYVYFGGGTPSFLSPEQLKYLVGNMQELLPWDDVEEVTFECEPGTLTEEKLETLKSLGITRISLGIENFEDTILKANGRAHRAHEGSRAYEYARSIGFHQINIDLIAGMLNETPENWRECVHKAIEWSPDCITIYQMEVPYNTTIYQRMQDEGEVTAPVADWPTKRAWVTYAYEELEKAGYTVTSAYTAVKDPKSYKFLYRDYLWGGADMIPLGVSSFGQFGGTHCQNEKDFDPYADQVGKGDFPIYRAFAMSEEEKLIRQLILQMKLGRLDRQHFRTTFGVDVVERFSEQFNRLRDEGHITIGNDEIVLQRQSLLIVDRLLYGFFLPQHQGERYT
jgi:oxygen-independent coproporphyrinogen III oxidase